MTEPIPPAEGGLSPGQRQPSSRSMRSWRLHIPVVIGVPGCFAAGWFELTRALGGREIAWVYAVEWPLYGVTGIYMWWRIWHSDLLERAAGAPPVTTRPHSAERPATAPVIEDAELAAWQDYLARLHAVDPPGGPPRRT